MGPGSPFKSRSPPDPSPPPPRDSTCSEPGGFRGAPLWSGCSFIEMLKALLLTHGKLLKVKSPAHLMPLPWFPPPSPAGAQVGVSRCLTGPLSPIQIRNVGTGLCADTKHGALGSPLRLESCVRGRGEAAWNNMQVRATPRDWQPGSLCHL